MEVLKKKLDEILGNRPATHPPVLVETLAEDPPDSQLVNSKQDSDETDTEKINSLEESNYTGDVSDNQSGGSSTASVGGTPPLQKGSSSSTSSLKEDSEELSSKDKAGIKGKKRKTSKEEILEDVMTKVVKTMSDGLRNSDKIFFELEEKRLKFEVSARSVNFSSEWFRCCRVVWEEVVCTLHNIIHQPHLLMHRQVCTTALLDLQMSTEQPVLFFYHYLQKKICRHHELVYKVNHHHYIITNLFNVDASTCMYSVSHVFCLIMFKIID